MYKPVSDLKFVIEFSTFSEIFGKNFVSVRAK